MGLSPDSLGGARPQFLGSWRSPAVYETCRGVTHTGFNRLACPARLTLPAVADSIRLGGGLDDAPSGGRLSSHACCISAVADCAGFVFAAPCAGVYLFPGCPSIPIRNFKESMSRFFLGAGSAAPAGSDFFLRGVSPATQTTCHGMAGSASVVVKKNSQYRRKLLESLRNFFSFFFVAPFFSVSPFSQ